MRAEDLRLGLFLPPFSSNNALPRPEPSQTHPPEVHPPEIHPLERAGRHIREAAAPQTGPRALGDRPDDAADIPEDAPDGVRGATRPDRAAHGVCRATDVEVADGVPDGPGRVRRRAAHHARGVSDVTERHVRQSAADAHQDVARLAHDVARQVADDVREIRRVHRRYRFE